MVAAPVNSPAVHGRQSLDLLGHLISLATQHHDLGVQPDQDKPQRYDDQAQHDLEDRHAVRPLSAARSLAVSHESGGTSPCVNAHTASA